MIVNNDTKERLMGFLLFLLDFYRALTGTYLPIFIPQTCGTNLCSLYSNITNHELLNVISLLLNTITFILFMLLFYVELKRENWCITNLDVNDDKSKNNLDNEIEKYPNLKKELLIQNKRYNNITKICIGSEGLNIITSITNIYGRLTSVSLIPLISIVLLISLKLKRCYETSIKSIKSEKVYSGFLTEQIVFNEIDKDVKEIISDSDTENPKIYNYRSTEDNGYNINEEYKNKTIEYKYIK